MVCKLFRHTFRPSYDRIREDVEDFCKNHSLKEAIHLSIPLKNGKKKKDACKNPIL